MAASYYDLGISAGFNALTMVTFLILYSVFSRKSINARVYFTKWFDVDPEAAERDLEKLAADGSGSGSGASKRRFWDFDITRVLHSTDWLWSALFMPQLEFIRHAGLDAFVFLNLHVLALKIFLPALIVGFLVLVPLNVTDSYLADSLEQGLGDYSDVDKLSLANITPQSYRLWAHVIAAYGLTFWACFLLRKEYENVANLRLNFLADLKKRPDQFSVLVRQVPENVYESVSQTVEHFFYVNHPDYYLLNQVVYNANKLASLEKQKKQVVNQLTAIHIALEKNPNLAKPTHRAGCYGLCGQKVDTMDFYDQKLETLNREIEAERRRVLADTGAIMPAAFVSFRKRWGASVAAQTQQCRESNRWITEWAPEPRDVYWDNLSIPYVALNTRKIVVGVFLAGLIVLFLFPVAFVQSLANLSSLQKKLPWLKPIIQVGFIKSFLQGFLPGVALTIVLAILPYVCKVLSRIEGWVSKSIIERKAAAKVYLVLLFNVFLGSVITGTIFEQVKQFLERPTQIPETFGNFIPTKAMFFITFVMVDGWTRVTMELFRLLPLLVYHFRGLLLVRTPADRVKAMNKKGPAYVEHIPRTLLYILFGFVYGVSTPLLLPFLLLSYAFTYAVFRVQLINVYVAGYESGASYWPFVHGRIVVAMIIHHVILFGILIAKKSPMFPALIVPLPVLTAIWHYVFCKGPYQNAFKSFSLEEAMKKDTIDAAVGDNHTVRNFLQNAYLHPAVKRARETDAAEYSLWRRRSNLADGPSLVPLKRYPTGLPRASHSPDQNAQMHKTQTLKQTHGSKKTSTLTLETESKGLQSGAVGSGGNRQEAKKKGNRKAERRENGDTGNTARGDEAVVKEGGSDSHKVEIEPLSPSSLPRFSGSSATILDPLLSAPGGNECR